MKKINWLITLSLMVLGACLVACSEKDDPWGGKSVVVAAPDYDAWTYFNLTTGESKTIKVKSQEGGVLGIYKGELEMGNASLRQKDVKVIISAVAEDTVLVTMSGLRLSMGGEIPPYSIAAKAAVKKNDGKWKLTGVPTVVKVSLGDKVIDFNDVTFSGEIGEAVYSEVSLKVTFKPGAMPMALSGGFYRESERDNKVYMLDGDETSFSWDIKALHKYDIKTNGGSAVKLKTTDLASVTLSSVSSETSRRTPISTKVIVDLSGMMDGIVGYQATKLNEVLCGWVTATPTGSMPPYTYELNANVFVVKTADGQYAKIKFSDFSNAENKKVYAAFDYEFPLK